MLAQPPGSRPRSDLPVWYEDGLRFECQPECGRCCTNHGKYAYVYLDAEDGPRLAEHLGLSLEEFHERHTALDEGERILRMDRPDCPFLDGWRCTVYRARPTQCRTFPFWDENLVSRSSWSRLAEFCPGIDRGERHSRRRIERQLALRER